LTQPESLVFDRIAAPYDRGMAPLERLWLQEMRAHLLPQARGKVLEIGVGTGANLPFYPPAVSLTAIDESSDMLSVAARRAVSLEQRVHLGRMDVESLAFPDACFDTIVASLVLCSVVDQQRTLGELGRVLRRPGGQLLLLEHMRPQARPLAWLTDLLNVPWYACNGRCHLNRETQDALLQAQFRLDRVESRAGGLLRLLVARTA
jgi:ubiquinone/menaquinone biosynthesis C-methylase UbiE